MKLNSRINTLIMVKQITTIAWIKLMLFFPHISKENQFGESHCFFLLSGHKGEKEHLKGYSKRRVCPTKARQKKVQWPI